MEFTENTKKYLEYIELMKSYHLLDKEGDMTSLYWNNIAVNYKYLKNLYKIFKKEMNFLELGCGIGNVLLFAKNIGYDVTGVEFDSKFIPYLRDFNHIHDNILNLEPIFYSKYDVIYAYVPLKNNYVNYLKTNVIANMKIDSYLITPTTLFNDDRIKMIYPFVYQKIK